MAALPSRLLARLDDDIARSREPLQRACLQAERAAYLARLGRGPEARRAIEALQHAYADAAHAPLSARLHWALGLCHYHADLGPEAWRCLQRAHALSAAAGLQAMQALCATWLAHVAMNRADDAALLEHLGGALALADPGDPAVQARLALVLAHCFHQSGRADRAQPWYLASRRHAGAIGDDATLSALLHNQAWCRAAEARTATLLGLPGGDRRQAQLGADSSLHFDAGVGAASLDTLPALLRAHLWVLEDRPAQALAMFEQALPAALAQGQAPWRACWLADMAWCHARLGQAEAARRRAAESEAALADLRHGLDRAQALAQLARTAALADMPAQAAAWHDRARHEHGLHEQRSRRLVEALERALQGARTAPC